MRVRVHDQRGLESLIVLDIPDGHLLEVNAGVRPPEYEFVISPWECVPPRLIEWTTDTSPPPPSSHKTCRVLFKRPRLHGIMEDDRKWFICVAADAETERMIREAFPPAPEGRTGQRENDQWPGCDRNHSMPW